MITVAKDGSGDYISIQEAVDSITSVPETIFIKNGIYRERVEITKDYITLIGENADGTVITNNYSAFMKMNDGSKRGTFRSYTFLINANHFNAYNITFENSAGFGKEAGQAIAVYAEGDDLVFKNCHMLGHQDTLFTGPLPIKEKLPGGFTGPTEFSPRTLGHQLYEDCFISGEIDFIFGSAICYFKNCELFALNQNAAINSYYTAPSTYKGQRFGYVFDKCSFTGNCPPRTTMISRPWRIYAKVVLIHCNLSEQICEKGYDDWNKPESHETCYYAEYECTGKGYLPEKRPDYIHQLTNEEAKEYTRENVFGR